jgi:uncharacterized protein YodC (DUF2158 family)
MEGQVFSCRFSVRHVAGGPVMTVEGPAARKGRLWCTWREGPLYFGAAFAKSSLVIIEAYFEKVTDNANHEQFASR